MTPLAWLLLVARIDARGDGLPRRGQALRSRSISRWLSAAALLIAGLAVLGAAGARAHDHDHAPRVDAERISLRPLPDVGLTDQDGRQVRLVSNVLRRRTALVSFIYTSCTTTCPLVGATVAAVAEDLQKNGSDVAIVSISVDPEYDTPARLLAWRERFGDIPQWTLLTGPRPQIVQLLRSFGAYSANPEDHSDILLVGPDAAGQWTRISSLAATDNIAAAIHAATPHAHR
jgi:protein SCO1